MTRPCIKRLNKLVRFSRKTAIVVIMVSVVAVSIALLVTLLFTPERNIKGRIEGLSREYYETYFYDYFTQSIPASNLESVLEKYTERGFSEVPLRQILFYDNGKNAAAAEEIGKYCDLNGTSVRFIPDKPFGATNYHTEYNYSCNF